MGLSLHQATALSAPLLPGTLLGGLLLRLAR